jgi:hypothetical protein
MGILDEAIREHLELKRQHGAADSELKQLEDEAFGPPARPGSEPPDAVSEAPTQFMAQPDVPEKEVSDAGEEKAPRREASIADLQEAPEQAVPAEEPEELPPAEEPVEEEQPAMEHEVVADAPEPSEPEPAGPSTEERHAISEQPTELYDVEDELAASGPPNPSDEDLVEEEISEPRLAPTDPLAGLGEGDVEPTVEATGAEEDEDDEFWNEQRLSDELDQALEAPREPEPELEEEPEDEPEPADERREPEAARDDDVLEETPDFLEETPEDDQLWFEQKPPKDFDFDD